MMNTALIHMHGRCGHCKPLVEAIERIYTPRFHSKNMYNKYGNYKNIYPCLKRLVRLYTSG